MCVESKKKKNNNNFMQHIQLSSQIAIIPFLTPTLYFKFWLDNQGTPKYFFLCDNHMYVLINKIIEGRKDFT